MGDASPRVLHASPSRSPRALDASVVKAVAETIAERDALKLALQSSRAAQDAVVSGFSALEDQLLLIKGERDAMEARLSDAEKEKEEATVACDEMSRHLAGLREREVQPVQHQPERGAICLTSNLEASKEESRMLKARMVQDSDSYQQLSVEKSKALVAMTLQRDDLIAWRDAAVLRQQSTEEEMARMRRDNNTLRSQFKAVIRQKVPRISGTDSTEVVASLCTDRPTHTPVPTPEPTPVHRV